MLRVKRNQRVFCDLAQSERDVLVGFTIRASVCALVSLHGIRMSENIWAETQEK